MPSYGMGGARSAKSLKKAGMGLPRVLPREKQGPFREHWPRRPQRPDPNHPTPTTRPRQPARTQLEPDPTAHTHARARAQAGMGMGDWVRKRDFSLSPRLALRERPTGELEMPRPAAREARQARFRHIPGFGYPFRASCPSTASFPGALGCRNTGFQPRRAASTRGPNFQYGQISPILFSDPCSCRGWG